MKQKDKKRKKHAYPVTPGSDGRLCAAFKDANGKQCILRESMIGFPPCVEFGIEGKALMLLDYHHIKGLQYILKYFKKHGELPKIPEKPEDREAEENCDDTAAI